MAYKYTESERGCVYYTSIESSAEEVGNIFVQLIMDDGIENAFDSTLVELSEDGSGVWSNVTVTVIDDYTDEEYEVLVSDYLDIGFLADKVRTILEKYIVGDELVYDEYPKELTELEQDEVQLRSALDC